MYHRVLAQAPSPYSDSSLHVMADTFAMHMNELLPFFKVVPIEEILNSAKNKQKLCAITFDDGWLDNYEIAFPILKKHKIPATIFIPTAMIGTKKIFWFESLWSAAHSAIKTHRQKEFISFFKDILMLSGSKKITQDYLLELTLNLKHQKNAIELDALISKAVKVFCPKSNKQRSLITWEEVNEMGKHGISFGSHCLHHYIIPTLHPNTKSQEITESFKQLIESTSAFTPFFSYPNGDWDDESISCLKAAHYKGAVTTRLGTVSESSNPYLLNRIPIHNYISKTPSLFWFRLFQATLKGN